MSTPVSESSFSRRPRTRRRIVVADDLSFWREKITSILEPGGHDVIAVENGEQAIRACLDPARPVDLLVLDLVMPGVDGFEVARQLRARKFTESLPIVAVTSQVRSVDFPEGHRARGFDSLVEKTASPEEFQFVLNKHLYEGPPARRPAQRVPCFLPATFVTDARREGKGSVTNISCSGAYLSTSTKLGDGENLRVQFSLPNGFAISASARVVRLSGPGAADRSSYGRGIGLRFTKLDTAAERSLSDWIVQELEKT